MIPKWIDEYIGVPFERCNCWQLVCKIYKEKFNVILPSFCGEYQDAMDIERISHIYLREMASRRFNRVDKPKLFNIVVLRIDGAPWHCGLVVDSDKKLMLHTHKNIDSAIEKFDSKLWRNRVLGFYEYCE